MEEYNLQTLNILNILKGRVRLDWVVTLFSSRLSWFDQTESKSNPDRKKPNLT